MFLPITHLRILLRKRAEGHVQLDVKRSSPLAREVTISASCDSKAMVNGTRSSWR